MKLVFLLKFMLTSIIAIKVLTTTDDIKNVKGNTRIKLEIKDINGGLKLHIIIRGPDWSLGLVPNR